VVAQANVFAADGTLREGEREGNGTFLADAAIDIVRQVSGALGASHPVEVTLDPPAVVAFDSDGMESSADGKPVLAMTDHHRRVDEQLGQTIVFICGEPTAEGIDLIRDDVHGADIHLLGSYGFRRLDISVDQVNQFGRQSLRGLGELSDNSAKAIGHVYLHSLRSPTRQPNHRRSTVKNAQRRA
jgi:hypothetical protein